MNATHLFAGKATDGHVRWVVGCMVTGLFPQPRPEVSEKAHVVTALARLSSDLTGLVALSRLAAPGLIRL